jgi:lipopolysaccharide export system ATP-binding protein
MTSTNEEPIIDPLNPPIDNTNLPEPKPEETILSAINLHKSFGKKHVVKGVSLSIKAGEIVGLLGPNGAGKSTVFKMLIGIYKPDHGKILFENENITKKRIYERADIGMAYLPQEKSIFRGLTVKENILAVLEFVEPNYQMRMAKLEQLLEELGLTALANNSSESLSGGETRRLEITRSLVTQPKLILLDEPFAAIDPLAVEEIKEIILKLSAKGISTIITDHNVRETLSITHRSYIISNGTLLKHGYPKDLVQDPIVKKTYLGQNFSL